MQRAEAAKTDCPLEALEQLMIRLLTGSVTLLVLGFTAACSDDPLSQNNQTASSATLVRGATVSADRGGNGPKRYIAVLDDCDPNDPAWAPTGGCSLKGGAVTNAEFGAFLGSPLSLSVVGHPAWRNEPSYIKIEAGQSVHVTNEGGRTHTFTEVANFGGGRVPPLAMGLLPAPECATATDLRAGADIDIEGLAAGNHKFQCCIHSWMRAAIKVLPDERGKKG